MKRIGRLRHLWTIGLVTFLATALAGASITIVDLPHTSPNWQGEAKCTGVTPGGTTLPMGGDVGYWPVNTLTGVIGALQWQFGTTTIHTGNGGTAQRDADDVWTFQWGSNLNGTLTVDHYKAYDKHTGIYCRHGAEFSCHYVPHEDDPENLSWVQVFTASYDKLGISSGTMIVDPFPNNGTDDAPFYFNEQHDPMDFYYPPTAPEGALIFGDTPGASHVEAEPFSVWLRLNLFLASWDDATPHALKIHDGIRWGYDGVCVPAPMSVILGAIGLAMVYRLRRRESERKN